MRTSVASSEKKASSSRSKTGSRATTPAHAKGDGAERQEMIAVAAYYHAERRGFDGGDPLADWLAAEAEIDAMLNASSGAAIH